MADEQRADHAAPLTHRLVTPSLAQLGPDRLAEVVAEYRRQLQHLAGQAYHCCAWALEAVDTLVDENRRLHAALTLATMELPAPKDGRKRAR